ncbi:hypothetical protein J2787_003665 [Chryseobacterium rhizosphaerae]|uniref:Uncharacterized protein n=1 Tax=Chryseobacterium rhizosphaerae TaxID=395937 RepID=A0AAE3YDM2_9FLAO|nr:hypothetical protein [Chryseobacterium rhizosphaerae]MDR6528246.1 hypothetical protein [Chryseobacterium rhizosphaerae]
MKLFCILFLLFCENFVFGQIDPGKIRKPNVKDDFEILVFQENAKLNETLYKTDIWISDISGIQYDYDYGVIINKNEILEKIKNFDHVDKRFLIRLIIAHEKMHAKQYFKWGKETFKRYSSLVSKEQLLVDETQADLVAGYNAMDVNNYKDIEIFFNIVRKVSINGFDSISEFTEKDINFDQQLKNNEINALKLFFSLGENGNYLARGANSYQRTIAIEMGMKAAYINRLVTYLKNHGPLSDIEKESYDQVISKLRNDIDFAYVESKKLDYFYDSWSFWTARKILNFSKELNKYIHFKLIESSEDVKNHKVNYKTSITNSNTKDSILINYSVLFKSKPKDYVSFIIFGAVNSMVRLKPGETKLISESLDIGMIEIFQEVKEEFQNQIVFPGQIGSLYYTALLNTKNSKEYYADRKENEVTDCYKCDQSVEDLIANLAVIHDRIENGEPEDFINGIGFQYAYQDYISYGVFLRGRPFEMLVYPAKSIFKITLYSDADISVVKKYLQNIIKEIDHNEDLKYTSTVDDRKNPLIIIKNTSNLQIGSLEIVFDKMVKEFQMQLKLIKS